MKKPEDWIDPEQQAQMEALKAAFDPQTRISNLEAENRDLRQQLADAKHKLATAGAISEGCDVPDR